MEPGTPIRMTFVLEATLTGHPAEVIELARAVVDANYKRKERIEAYPLDLEDAFHILIADGGVHAFPLDGPVSVISSSGKLEEVSDAWWSKRDAEPP